MASFIGQEKKPFSIKKSSLQYEIVIQGKSLSKIKDTCIPVADSFWYLEKLIQFVKFKNKIKLKKIKDKKKKTFLKNQQLREFIISRPALQ